jgi:hypothetical protein
MMGMTLGIRENGNGGAKRDSLGDDVWYKMMMKKVQSTNCSRKSL